MDAVPRHAGKFGDGCECHLLGHHQDQRLEQQGEARELAEPVRLYVDNTTIRQLHPWRPDLQETLMLEEVEMPQPLDDRIVNRQGGARARNREARPRREVDANCQRPLLRIELHTLDVPGRADAEGGFEELVRNTHDISLLPPASPPAWQGDARPSRTLRAAARWPAAILDRRTSPFRAGSKVGTEGWSARSNRGMVLEIPQRNPLKSQKRRLNCKLSQIGTITDQYVANRL